MRTYTNRHRRNNLLRAMCVRFMRTKMPLAYQVLAKAAERKYRNERITRDGKAY